MARVARVDLPQRSMLKPLYAKAGFVKTGEETHNDWGRPAVSEYWDLEL